MTDQNSARGAVTGEVNGPERRPAFVAPAIQDLGELSTLTLLQFTIPGG